MEVLRKRLFTVLICSFFLVLTNCQRQDGGGERAGKKVDTLVQEANAKIEKSGESLAGKIEIAAVSAGDAAITGKIKQEIISDPSLKVSEIEVTTTDGVVKLSGTVNSQTSLNRIVEMAGSVKDVKSVETGLVVKRY